MLRENVMALLLCSYSRMIVSYVNSLVPDTTPSNYCLIIVLLMNPYHKHVAQNYSGFLSPALDSLITFSCLFLSFKIPSIRQFWQCSMAGVLLVLLPTFKMGPGSKLWLMCS